MRPRRVANAQRPCAWKNLCHTYVTQARGMSFMNTHGTSSLLCLIYAPLSHKPLDRAPAPPAPRSCRERRAKWRMYGKLTSGRGGRCTGSCEVDWGRPWARWLYLDSCKAPVEVALHSEQQPVHHRAVSCALWRPMTAFCLILLCRRQVCSRCVFFRPAGVTSACIYV